MNVTLTHPATYSSQIMAVFHDLVADGTIRGPVLDPFAGVGTIHELHVPTVGIELEPEWAALGANHVVGSGEVIVGDSLAWMRATRRRFRAVVTSPCYGNRMADHHEAKDPCKPCGGLGVTDSLGHVPCRKCKGTGLSMRNTYRHRLGRPLSPGSSAGLQWGPDYRRFHQEAWEGVWRVLGEGDVFVLNAKDHIRAGHRIRVAWWHRQTARGIGFVPERTIPVRTPGNRHGANRDLRAGSELVYVFRKPLTAA